MIFVRASITASLLSVALAQRRTLVMTMPLGPS